QCEIVARDPGIDVVAWSASLPGKGGVWDDVSQLRRLLSVTDKPVLGFGRMIYQMTADGLAVQEQAGFPFLQGLEPTLRAINGLWFHAKRTGRAPPRPGPAPASDLTPENLDATLVRYGIVQPKGRVAVSANAAADAAAAIGFPVALKI